jgi:golgin subfamily B member 1
VDPKQTAAAAGGRAELDLAHYMLHQRDMRCEELTVELISLLEERDSLQLRLSTALRQNEEIKQRAGIYDADISGSSDMSKTTTPEKVAQLPGAEAEAQQTPRSLREQQLREEREQRYRQMNLLQRDLSNMPPEAVATLMGK